MSRNRRSPRLRGHGYSRTATYFVTVCTHQRELIFGSVYDMHVSLSTAGAVVDTAAKSIPDHYNHVALDCHIVMPNHIHLLLSLYERPDANVAPLGVVIGTFKAQVTREVNRIDSAFGRIWQSRYHDHIVRSPDELERIRAYIRFNPVNWQDDTFFVDYT